MREVTTTSKFGKDLMAATYVDLANRAPAKRGDEISKYYVKTVTEAMEYLKTEKKTKELDTVKRAMTAKGVSID